VAHTNVLGTKAKNGKTYNRYTKQRIWTLHKASECKLDSPKERKAKEEEDDKGLLLKQALADIY